MQVYMPFSGGKSWGGSEFLDEAEEHLGTRTNSGWRSFCVSRTGDKARKFVLLPGLTSSSNFLSSRLQVRDADTGCSDKSRASDGVALSFLFWKS
jgi:hypothetical protein